ncbi:MAG: hypothetical protein ACI9YE_000464 [Psychroserpens sp.]|jgi:hypothetical protein
MNKFIDGYDKKYIISQGGSVLNYETMKFVTSKLDGKYIRLSLLNNKGVTYKCLLHRLLALAFIPNPDNKKFIDHYDKDTLNNNIDNLRWSTSNENQQNRSNSKTNTSGQQGVSIRVRGNCTQYIATWWEGTKRKSKCFQNLHNAICHRQSMVHIHYINRIDESF